MNGDSRDIPRSVRVMTESLARRFWLAAFIVVCCAGAIYQVWRTHDAGDLLSRVDPFSEANELREVDGFYAQGFWHDAGLGNVLFGPRFPDEGFAQYVPRNPDGSFASPTLHERLPGLTTAELDEAFKRQVTTPNGVYTHYPPGPEYVLYLDEAVLGPEPVSRLRLLPIAIGAAATVFFGLSVRRRFGAVAGWIVIVASLTVVAFSDAHANLHEYGYALSLLLVEIGVAIGLNRLRWPFLLLGFLQGWLSFDQFFLVVLAPLAVELSLPVITPGYEIRWRLAVERCFLAGVGFGFAHLLHFVEVWAYYGSLSRAISDMHDSALWRVAGKQDLENGWTGTVIANFKQHLFSTDRPDTFKFLGLKLGTFWIVVALVFLAVGIARIRRGLSAFDLLGRWALMGLIGIVGSCAWYVVMAAHTHHHVHLHYRHLILCFELWTIFLAVLAAGPIGRWLARTWPNIGIGPRSPLATEVAKSGLA